MRIRSVKRSADAGDREAERVILQTAFGGSRIVDMLVGGAVAANHLVTPQWNN